MKTRKMNPVTKAVAMQKLRDAVVDQKLAVYSYGYGDKCAELVTGIAMTLSWIAYAAELDPAVDHTAPSMSILRGGLSACEQMAKADFWDPMNAVSISLALDKAGEVNKLISDRYITLALARLTGAA